MEFPRKSKYMYLCESALVKHQNTTLAHINYLIKRKIPISKNAICRNPSVSWKIVSDHCISNEFKNWIFSCSSDLGVNRMTKAYENEICRRKYSIIFKYIKAYCKMPKIICDIIYSYICI